MNPAAMSEPPLRPRPAGCTVPLSDMQKLLWTHALSEGRHLNRRYFAMGIRILGPLNIGLLETCLCSLIRRHEPLRTRLVRLDGTHLQWIDPPGDYCLETVDLADLPANSVEDELRMRGEEFVEQKFDRSVDPLFGAKLWRLSRHEHVLILSLDHVITDLLSNVVVCRDLWTLYRHAVSGGPVLLPQLALQFADYTVWQQQRHGAWLQRHGPYWQERLQGVRPAAVPVDNGSPTTVQPVAVALQFALGLPVTAGLRDLAQRNRTLLPMVVLAVYSAVMSSWCGQEDLLVAVVQHGRFRPELAQMVGWLNSFLRLRLDLQAAQSCQDLIVAVTREFHQASAHEDFNRVPALVPECATDLHFDWLPRGAPLGPSEVGLSGEGLKLRPYSIARKTPPQKCAIFFADSPQGIVGRLYYRSNLFLPDTMRRLVDSLRQCAEEFVLRPHVPVGSILSGLPTMRHSGSATTASSNPTNCRANRSTVAASNRSVA